MDKVAVLLALYNPNIDWLEKLLDSVNRQTYKNIFLYAIDDCSDKISLDLLKNIFKNKLVNINWNLKRNKFNMGSNKTFELLTDEADGDYFAYCDQDDIWACKKIEKLVDIIKNSNSVLVYSDMSVIDEKDNKIAKGISDIEKGRKFKKGFKLYSELILGNFITGCTMLIRSDIAKSAVPFAKNLFHDHWLAIFSAYNGYIDYTKEKLVLYRIHGNNQSRFFDKIHSKKDYFKYMILKEDEKYKELESRLACFNDLTAQLKNMRLWADARRRYFNKHKYKDLRIIFKFRNFGVKVSLFEIVLPFVPNIFFNLIMNLKRKGIF